MNKFMTIAASLLATATLFAVTPGVATAQSSVTVRYSDLNLASPAGQKNLERRIIRAARSVCGIEDQATGTRIASGEAAACYDKALRDVRQSVASAIESSQRGG